MNENMSCHTNKNRTRSYLDVSRLVLDLVREAFVIVRGAQGGGGAAELRSDREGFGYRHGGGNDGERGGDAHDDVLFSIFSGEFAFYVWLKVF